MREERERRERKRGKREGENMENIVLRQRQAASLCYAITLFYLLHTAADVRCKNMNSFYSILVLCYSTYRSLVVHYYVVSLLASPYSTMIYGVGPLA